MASVLELLRGRLQQRADNAVDVLAQAARDHAAGVAVDVGAVESALIETRQTADDFSRLCETAAKRREASEAFAQLPAAATRLAKATAAVEQEQKKFDEIHDAYLQRISTLDAERAVAQEAVTAGERGRGVLLDQRLVIGGVAAKYRAAISAKVEADQLVAACERELKEATAAVKSESEQIEILASGEPHSRTLPAANAAPGEMSYRLQDHYAAKKRAERRVAELTTQLSDARKALAEAGRRLAELEAVVLKS